ncbi:hypothetical protein FNJ47_48900, partial [Bradyrhizobium sp. UFLA 03-164]|nr:hypothetical protein [Bradyrhizobium uaiense]
RHPATSAPPGCRQDVTDAECRAPSDESVGTRRRTYPTPRTKGESRRHAMSQVNRNAKINQSPFHSISHYNSPGDVLNDAQL